MQVLNPIKLLLKITLIAIAFACNKHPVASTEVNINPPAKPASDSGTIQYLALGDSYTIGESVSPADRYPVIAAAMLKASGRQISEPKIIAKTGWTTGELQAAIDATKFEGKYELVTLLIGVNNQYRGGSPAVYRQEFEKNLSTAIALADDKPQHVIVLSIPDYGATPFGQRAQPEKIGKEIDLFNTINKAVADSIKVNYLDITPDSRRALNDPTMVADDNLHFSGKMYKIWAEKLADVVKTNW